MAVTLPPPGTSALQSLIDRNDDYSNDMLTRMAKQFEAQAAVARDETQQRISTDHALFNVEKIDNGFLVVFTGPKGRERHYCQSQADVGQLITAQLVRVFIEG